MVRFLLLAFLLAVALTVIALISCISAERGEVRGLPRWAWILVILLLPVFGPALYLVGGRPARPVPPDPATARRPLAPDDDPDFLSRFGRPGTDDLLRQWEADLRQPDDPRERRSPKPEETPPNDG